MSVLLKNAQTAVRLQWWRLEKDVKLLRQICRVEKFDIGVMCVDTNTMTLLNKRYRKEDRPTDILSFPFFEEQVAGQLPQPQHPDEYNLGDIFLLPSYIAARCQEEDHELHDMITILLTHGMCHLLGYDHETEQQWKKMFHHELYVLNEYSKLTGVKLKPITAVGH